MTTSAERFDEKARGEFGRLGRTVVHEGELLRHPVYTRFLHWTVAIFFFLALLSGMAIYSPWLFRWLAPLFGGGPMTRLLHPWFGLFFVIFYALQSLNWLALMRWTRSDTKWLRNIRGYVKGEEKVEPEYVGFFNGGQKLQFWEIIIGGGLLLLTGLMMWFPEVFGRILVAISYVIHDIAALVMLFGIWIHIYLSTVGQPGTLQAMTRGVVTKAWAWTNHPAWYSEATGRDAREDYDRALDRQQKRHRLRERAMEEEEPPRRDHIDSPGD
ncbi:MAG TPA: formate dehydrogenase subunit gamma [Blastocatellia bacterium]|jgi:formate dehydrogenase subunit gamma|nr:formate dehydrogenase subunit gamma [Blastocatellia bacterium]